MDSHGQEWNATIVGLGLLGVLYSALGAGGRAFDLPHPDQQVHACISTASRLRSSVFVDAFGLTISKPSLRHPTGLPWLYARHG